MTDNPKTKYARRLRRAYSFGLLLTLLCTGCAQVMSGVEVFGDSVIKALHCGAATRSSNE